MASLISWSDLPKEILTTIKNSLLESPSDVSCFRSVCSSWRASIPPLKISLPFPEVVIDDVGNSLHVNQIIFYCIQLLVTETTSAMPSSWIIAIQFVGDKLYLVDPLSSYRIDLARNSKLPRELNLCDFRITELQKVYTTEILKFDPDDDDTPRLFSAKVRNDFNKVVFISSGTHYDETMLAILHSTGNLRFYKLKENQWISLDKQYDMQIVDIILYEGRLWGVDNNGVSVVFTASLEASEIAPRMEPENCLINFYFVKSQGEIFLVDHKKDDAEVICNRWIPIRVYKMNGEEKRWEEVKHLDNRVIFIASRFPWSFWISFTKGNCVFVEGASEKLIKPCYWNLQNCETMTLDVSKEFSKFFWPFQIAHVDEFIQLQTLLRFRFKSFDVDFEF